MHGLARLGRSRTTTIRSQWIEWKKRCVPNKSIIRRSCCDPSKQLSGDMVVSPDSPSRVTILPSLPYYRTKVVGCRRIGYTIPEHSLRYLLYDTDLTFHRRPVAVGLSQLGNRIWRCVLSYVWLSSRSKSMMRYSWASSQCVNTRSLSLIDPYSRDQALESRYRGIRTPVCILSMLKTVNGDNTIFLHAFSILRSRYDTEIIK